MTTKPENWVLQFIENGLIMVLSRFNGSLMEYTK